MLMVRPSILALGAVAAAGAAIQCVPIERNNPVVRGDLVAPPQVKLQLRRACFDCHSNETTWRWYSTVAPFSWVVVRDVTRGRQRLNFSEWTDYASDPETRTHKLDQIAASVTRGDMAPWYYGVLHPESRLDLHQRELIIRWANQEATRASP
jgi:hypothetical protein